MPMQAEMQAIIDDPSAEANNARLDRIFERLYKLRGSDLKGLADELEKDEGASRRECEEHLFQVASSRLVLAIIYLTQHRIQRKV